MTINKLKLSSASFDYYVLQINSHCEVDEIDSKFSTLRAFDCNARFIVLDIAELIDEAKFLPLMQQLDRIAERYNLIVKFVLQSAMINEKNFAGKAVIDLPATLKSAPIQNQTKFINTPLRSGMVVKNDGDIIVTDLVSNNSEVIAGGNIHIYGDCRGRILAGVNGDKSARIFANKFNAEFISIAGVYRVIEDKLPANLENKAVQIFLDDKERLNIVRL